MRYLACAWHCVDMERLLRFGCYLRLLIFCVGILLALGACQTLKNVPEGEYLLERVDIQSEGRPAGISNAEIRRHVHQQPNAKVLFMRFHLWLYNLGKKGKETGFSGWLHRIGEAPVVYSESSTVQSVQNLEQYLRNRGYYGGVVQYTAVPSKRRRMRVEYSLDFGVPTLIDSVRVEVRDTAMRALVEEHWSHTLLQRGIRLDKKELDEERKRIEALLRNEGFFNFSADYVGFSADTLGHRHRAQITLQIPPSDMPTLPLSASRRYVVDSINVFTKYDPLSPASSSKDSLTHRRIGAVDYYFPRRAGIRLPIVNQMLLLRRGALLRYGEVAKTQDNLLNLGLYRQANFEFRERLTDSVADSTRQYFPINGDLYLSRFPVQGYQLEALLTASGELGMEGSFTYKHRNLFQGSEQLELRFQAQIEALRRRQSLDFKTSMELSWRVALTFPRFLLPFRANEFITRYRPSTRFNFTYNYQRRPDYRRTVASSAVSYVWSNGGAFTYVVTPAEVSVVKIFSIDEQFAARIRRTYLAHSYISQLVTSTSFGFTFQQSANDARRSSSTLRGNLELSGNALWGLHRAFGQRSRTGEYRLFDLPFSQYVKGDVNYAVRVSLGKYHSLAFRIYAGAGLPYGNSVGLPFEKKFYEGGASGVRAWQARDLGPGSYRDEELSYPNQTGDVKLEGNVEYRFSLFWKLEGALFVDAGNIWAISASDERPGARFAFNRFYREIAMGYGLGLRLNLSFFIIRTDLGIRLYDPHIPQSTSMPVLHWVPAQRPYTSDDFVLHLGVGYPF